MKHELLVPRRTAPQRRLRPGEGAALTTREIEILELVSRGFESRDIARELYVSPETVRSHVAHALAKLDARTRAEAVAIAVREGLIE